MKGFLWFLQFTAWRLSRPDSDGGHSRAQRSQWAEEMGLGAGRGQSSWSSKMGSEENSRGVCVCVCTPDILGRNNFHFLETYQEEGTLLNSF